MKKTKKITLIGVLSALAVILFFLDFPLFFYFPPYLKLDFSDIPAILGAIAYGPVIGVAIEFIKNVIHFLFRGNTPFGCGEIGNFFAGVGLLVPIAVILRRKTRFSFLPYVAGAISMVIVANIINYFVTLPLYGINKEAIWPTIINFLVPFNLLKATIVSVITAALYSKLKVFLERQ